MQISIIIPVYNVADYITPCLQSIINQSFTDYELILVDDCGEDDSMVIAHQLLDGTQVSVKWLLHEWNRGLSAARNTGLQMAEGKYILFVDSDDQLMPGCLEKLWAKAEETQADVTMGDIHIQGNSGWIPKLKVETDVVEGQPAALHSYLYGEYYMMAWNKLLRHSFLEQHNVSFIEGLIHEDNPWSFQVACLVQKLAFVHEETYNYVVRENSLQTGKCYTRHFVAYCKILKEIAHQAQQMGVSKDSLFVAWFERQKALFYQMTVQQGSQKQLCLLYSIIRKVLPCPAWSKTKIHYMLPAYYGQKVYNRMCKHLLC